MHWTQSQALEAAAEREQVFRSGLERAARELEKYAHERCLAGDTSNYKLVCELAARVRAQKGKP